jgi:hypothetical protein
VDVALAVAERGIPEIGYGYHYGQGYVHERSISNKEMLGR